MFIDIFNKENKAIKINEFTPYNSDKNYFDAVKMVADFGIVFEGDRIKIDYYQMYFDNKESKVFGFKDTLNFLTLFDCFRFLLSDSFEYLGYGVYYTTKNKISLQSINGVS